MLPIIPKPPITPRQKALAVSVAGISDALQLIILPFFTIEGFLSPIQDFIDFVTAAILVAICGFKWQFVLAFALELVPALDLFPTWTAVALMLPSSPAPPVGANRIEASSSPNSEYPPIDVTATVVPPVQTTPSKGRA